jgi:hypothetical protein
MASAVGDSATGTGRNERSSDATRYDENAGMEDIHRTPMETNNKATALFLRRKTSRPESIASHRQSARG